MTCRDLLRSEGASLEINEVLRTSPRILLGVESFAVDTLASMGITSVFDLATSATFAGARLVLDAAADPSTPSARLGRLPADLFTEPVGVGVADAAALDVDALRALPGPLAGNVREAFAVSSIRELALWPPYVAARHVLDEADGTAPDEATQTPGDLLPMSGRYATERAFYSTYVLADLDDPGGRDKQALEDAGPLDPAAVLQGSGFARPVRGARLTLAQSWFSEGVALGQLLHSLALAPGESTRVAMIDWSRQQTGMQTEADKQTEQLVGDITRKRALSEVQNAVAAETQNGFSTSSASAQQRQGGVNAGLGAGALTLGGSFSAADSASSSTTVTGSSGVRNVAAAMNQNVVDSTHQAASSARDRFASVVRELSQAEHEQLSTRVVANYNHMHALTVQYYEVVQIFRVVVGLHRFEPCLFVPMQLVQFEASPGSVGGTGELLVRRFRGALAAAALDEQTQMMLDPDGLGLVRALPSAPQAPGAATVLEVLPTEVEARFETQAGALRQVFGRDPVVRDGTAAELPAECTLTGIGVDFSCAGVQLVSATGAGAVQLVPTAVSGQAGHSHVAVTPAVPLSALTTIEVDTGGQNLSGVLTLGLDYRGMSIEVPLVVATIQSPGYQLAARFVRHEAPAGLLQRLQEGQLYYSQAIWRAMDTAAVAALLAPYSYAGRSLAQVVDPTPIDVTGNFLVFRMPWEARDLLDVDPDTLPATDPAGTLAAVLADTAWSAWVRRHADFTSTIEDLVPLPSGGVFAEAVLGRSNSAEKLDITRFWNWQDSPIPLQAPDIAALQAGSRARDDTTTPSGFATPIVTFNNAPSVPDPTGLSGALGAVANGGMFRDMSGASVSQALAQAALQQAGQGAAAGGAQAAASLAAAAQKEVEMAKLAAGLVSGGLVGGPTGTVSEQGARINEGRSLDERAAPAEATNGTNGTKADTGGEAVASSHEAQAAEGHGNRVLDLVGSLLTTKSPATSSNSSSTPTSKPDEPSTPGD